ncbi:cellulase family glycosylhydrolase [Streptomyces bryophytorum]|nr:cellulase family glycosylhydrolase [Actinacidiphila bryophytorum]
MYVIINMHGDGYKTVTGSWLICDSSSQTAIKAEYQKVWQQIASRFQSYDQHLILESMNEEFTGQYGDPTQPCYANINAYNQIFVDTVRQAGGSNSSRWLLVPGWNTNIDYTAGNYGFVLPTDSHRSSSIPSGEQRIMISVHYYDPWDFAGDTNGTITQWGPAATDPSRTSTWGQEDYLDAQLKKMHDGFVAKGYPVVVGEYGSIDKSSSDSASNRYRADYARAVTATATKYGAAAVYWDNGVNGQYGFGLFDRNSSTVTQQGIVDAIMSGTSGGTTAGGTTTTGGSTGGGGLPVHAVGAGKCLDVPGGTQANGTQLDIRDCNGSTQQTWTATSSKQLTVYSGAKCLDAYRKGTTAGTAVDLYDCNGGSNQQWNVNSNGTITSAQSGLCLDVTGASTANGALVELWTCNGGANQQWKLG